MLIWKCYMYVRVVQDMYERSSTVVRCAVGQTEEFKVEVGLHQGSALSPFLFAIVMDQLLEELRNRNVRNPSRLMAARDDVTRDLVLYRVEVRTLCRPVKFLHTKLAHPCLYGPCFVHCMGTIVLELYWKHAPKTCKNFAELGRRGYYNNTKFHRIIKDFMVQGGDPTGTGRGGACIYGKQFEDELHPELKFTGAGILAMANTGPDTNGSQFFLTLAPTQWLDGKHSIFGRVCQGMSVLSRIGMVETNSQDRPVEEITILRVNLSN
ncbi:hypothetical protein QTP86_025513 [Hemibagrus guttatus]|nr:hypothetical protein QTP86_025513 [Hemibagrus guttatus]